MAEILHANWNSLLILPACLKRLCIGGVAAGVGETSQGLWGNLIDIYSSNDD